jgi:hypothetical protein
VIYGPTILSEEAFLRRTFPAFEEYARRVPRLFPRLTPARFESANGARTTSGGFSGELYARHREYNAALGAIAIYAALLVRIIMVQRHF